MNPNSDILLWKNLVLQGVLRYHVNVISNFQLAFGRSAEEETCRTESVSLYASVY